MGKNIALKDFVEVDGTDLSDMARAVTPVSERTLVDASGFNATGSDENLVGNRTSSLTVTFFDDTDSGSVHETLWQPHLDATPVLVRWRRDQTAAVSATDPSLEANAYVRTYSPSRTRGDVSTFECEFVSADPTGFVYVTVPGP